MNNFLGGAGVLNGGRCQGGRSSKNILQHAGSKRNTEENKAPARDVCTLRRVRTRLLEKRRGLEVKDKTVSNKFAENLVYIAA